MITVFMSCLSKVSVASFSSASAASGREGWVRRSAM